MGDFFADADAGLYLTADDPKVMFNDPATLQKRLRECTIHEQSKRKQRSFFYNDHTLFWSISF